MAIINGVGRVGIRNYVAPSTTSITTSGLVLNLDAGNTLSYPGTGTTWTDLSGNLYNGTLVNGTAYTSANNGSLVFDGVNDYVDAIGSVSNFSFIQNTNVFSVNIWFKLGTINGDQIIMGTSITTIEKGFALSYNYANNNYGYRNITLGVYNGISDNFVSLGATDDYTISTTGWYNVCYSIDNTQKGQFYINGVAVNTTIRNGSKPVTNAKPTGNSTRTLNVGRGNYSSTIAPLLGNVSNVQIYNKALSSTEVANNFNALKSRYGYTNYTPRTTAFAAATGITDTTILNALNTFDTGLISNGLDTKMKALYPFVGGTANTHKYNFMDARDLDVAYRLAFNGGWVHSANGIQGNGTNTYANTFLNENVVITANSEHMAIYSRTDANGTYCDIGLASTMVPTCIFSKYANNFNAFMNNGTANIDPAVNTSLGLFIATRNNSSTINAFNKNVKTSSNLTFSTLNNWNVYVGALNRNNTVTEFFTPRQYAFSSIGNGLSDTDASTLYTLVQAFQTSLSRAV
jgi:hypothetical protein